MNERIKEIRKEAKESMEQFGKRIGITKASVSRIESGENNPSDQTIILICKEYNINEEWLRTGKGEMHKETDDKLSAYVAEIAIGDDDFIKDLITTYMELDTTSKAALKKLAYAMVEKRKKREQD